MKPGLHCRYHKSIPRARRRVIRAAANRFSAVMEIVHPVIVYALDVTILRLRPAGGYAFAVFLAGLPSTIYLATRFVDLPLNVPPKAVQNLAHELVHYIQFRDGRPQTERGVEAKARKILKEAGYL